MLNSNTGNARGNSGKYGSSGNPGILVMLVTVLPNWKEIQLHAYG